MGVWVIEQRAIILSATVRSPTVINPKYGPGIRDTLRWRHNGHDNVSNRQPHDCLLNRLFRCRSKKTSKLRVTGLCAGNSPGAGEFPAQMASNAENVSIWCRHHEWLLRDGTAGVRSVLCSLCGHIGQYQSVYICHKMSMFSSNMKVTHCGQNKNLKFNGIIKHIRSSI